MLAGEDREALFQFADRLCAELGFSEGEAVAIEMSSSGVGARLDPEDEELITAVCQSLAQLAAALRPEAGEGPPGRAVELLLGGVDFVLRREVTMANPARLKEVLPSAVYLVTVLMIEPAEAQELADRASTLLDEILEGQESPGGSGNDPS